LDPHRSARAEAHEYRRYFRPERNPVIVEVLKRERRGRGREEWNAIVIRPRIPNGGGIFAEKADARMWLSDDSLRVMVGAAVEVLVRPGDAQAQGDRLDQGELAARPEHHDGNYREADFSRLKTVPIAQRPNKVDPSLLAHPPGGDPSFTAFWDSLPDILAAKDNPHGGAAAGPGRGRRGVVAMLGGHVIKVGLGPLLRELIRRGVITHLALNGSAAIHDFELARTEARAKMSPPGWQTAHSAWWRRPAAT